MSWLSRLSELHVKCATLFDRVGGLSDSVESLSGEIHDVSVRVGRVEGAIVNGATPEVLRQLAELHSRMSAIEARLEWLIADKRPLVLSNQISTPQLETPKKPSLEPG